MSGMDLKDLVVPLGGLASGRHSFGRKLGREFFAEFDEDAVLDASVDVDVEVTKSSQSSISVVCRMHGWLGVPCDRCLERVDFPVEVGRSFTVKFSAEDACSEEDDDGVMLLPREDCDLDLRQYVYDYAMLSLPMRRVHAEGECNPEMIRILERSKEPAKEAESPFAVLKGLYGGKDEI